MYVILLRYLKPIEEVERATPAHRAYLDTLYAAGKLVCSGPREPRTGGVMIANVDTDRAVSEIIAEDPYFTEGIAEYEPIRFNVRGHDPRFAPFLAPAGG